jgi:hypothetical protein
LHERIPQVLAIQRESGAIRLSAGFWWSEFGQTRFKRQVDSCKPATAMHHPSLLLPDSGVRWLFGVHWCHLWIWMTLD